MNFDEAFDAVIRHEGAYVNDRRDPGGETKYGISKAAYPSVDIASLTLAQAKAIYLKDYWGPAGCDAIPDKAKLQVFDAAVNHGVKNAIRLVQRACGAVVDGSLGPATLQAIGSMDPIRFGARFNAQRLALYAGLSNWPAFGRGWALRVTDNLMAL